MVDASNVGVNVTTPADPVTTNADNVASADGTLYVVDATLPFDPVLIRFVASTVNVYTAPFVKLDASHRVVVPDTEHVIGVVAPDVVDVTVVVYPVIVEPPSVNGVAHENCTSVGVAASTVKLRGTPGTVDGYCTTCAVFPAISAVFALVIATTWKSYDVPLSRPVTRYDDVD